MNNAPPIDETRYTTVPAQPGWFVFELEGSYPDYKILKAPIVAWLVETEFYPRPEWNEKARSRRLAKPQNFISEAYPVLAGSLEGTDNTMLGPDGVVYQLDTGNYWPDLDSYIRHDQEQAEAAELASDGPTKNER